MEHQISKHQPNMPEIAKPVSMPLSMTYIQSLGWQADDVAIFEAQYKGLAIRELKPADVSAKMKATLIRIAVITGCKMPENDIYLKVLYSEVTKTLEENRQYSSLSFEEIELAFRMNASGELGQRVKHWNNTFNLDYLGEVLDHYIHRRAEVRKLQEPHMPKKQQNITVTDWKESCEKCYQEFRSGKYNLSLWPWQCYDELKDLGFIVGEVGEAYLISAKEYLIRNLNRQLEDMQMMRQPQLMESVRKTLKDVVDNGKCELIVQTAKKLVVIDLFKAAHSKKYEHLFERE